MSLALIPSFAQTPLFDTSSLSAEYQKYVRLKNTGVAGIVVFGTAWLSGNVICMVEQNRYANDHWDGVNVEDFVTLSNEAKKQKSYKVGQAVSIVGFAGTLLSGYVTSTFNKKAKEIRNANGEVLALLGMDVGLGYMGLNLTF